MTATCAYAIDEKINLLRLLTSDEEKFNAVLDKLLDVVRNDYGKQLVQISTIIEKYEQQYQLTSHEFYDKFNNGVMGDETDFVEWASLIEMQKDVAYKINLLKSNQQ